MSQAQDAMHARRVARRTMMKRIAKGQPMLDQETISAVFAKLSIAGDVLCHEVRKSDGRLGFAKFCYGEEDEVFVWVFSNGTYECVCDRPWDPDILDWAACVGRCAAFVTALNLKRRPS